MAYDTAAQEFAYSYYARGWSKARAIAEIRKVYPGFSGSTWDEWERKLDWKQRRAAADVKLREFEDLCRDTARVLLLELDQIRQQLFAKAKEPNCDTQTYYAYTNVAKQIGDLTAKTLAGRDGDRVAIDVLNAAFEKLLSGMRSFDDLAVALESHASEIGQLVESIVEQCGREKRASA